MRKIIPVAVLVLFLGGCATYRFQHGEKPYDKGYVASRGGYTILEYTVGSDNSVPADLEVARSRFKRRRRTVEHYYKKMGEIQNRFKATFVDPAVMGLKFLGGMLKLPCVAVSDYRYEHNPKYREKIDSIELEQDQKEAMRIALLKEQLAAYIQKDLSREVPVREDVPAAPAAPALKDTEDISAAEADLELPVAEPPVESQAASDFETAPIQESIPDVEPAQPLSESRPEAVAAVAPAKEKAKERPKVVSQPKAVIIAKPMKGYSPLKVRFYGSKSYSRKAKIVSYQWDFGDGDVSDKPNPVNTYYSGSYYPKHFAVTLTVTDSQGYSDSAHLLIEVLNK